MRWVLFVSLVAACGAEDPPDPYACMAAGGAACFELPTTAVEAIDVADNPVDAAFDCDPIAAAPNTTTIGGHTIDLMTRMPMPNIEVRIDTIDTISDEYAELTVTPPTTLANWLTLGDGQLSLLEVAKPARDKFDAYTTTKADISALVMSVSDRFLPARSQLITHIRDCNGSRLLNTIINVAPATGRHGTRLFTPGVRTYYYASDTGELMRRTQLAQTTRESAAVATNLSPGMQFVQLWGFKTAADVPKGSVGLELLAEIEIEVPEGENALLVPLTTSR